MMVKSVRSNSIQLGRPGESIKRIRNRVWLPHREVVENSLGDDYSCRHILIVPTSLEDEAIEACSIDRLDSCYQQLLKAGEITWDDAVLKYSNDEFNEVEQRNHHEPSDWSISNVGCREPEPNRSADLCCLRKTFGRWEISLRTEPLLQRIFERKQGVRIVRN